MSTLCTTGASSIAAMNREEAKALTRQVGVRRSAGAGPCCPLGQSHRLLARFQPSRLRSTGSLLPRITLPTRSN